MFQGIVNVLIDPEIKVAKKLLIFISTFAMVIFIDYYLGFSEFTIQHNKVEALKDLSFLLKDSSLTQKEKEILKSDYSRILKREALIVTIFQSQKSSNSTSTFNGISVHPLHRPKEGQVNSSDVRLPSVRSILIELGKFILKAILFLLTGGLPYYILSLILYWSYRKNVKQGTSTNPNGGREAGSIIYVGFLVAGISAFLPPYASSEIWRYLLNILYSLISLIIVAIIGVTTTFSTLNKPE